MPGLASATALKRFGATARDDDFVAQSVKCFSQAAADSGAASGDQNGVARQLHAFSSPSLSVTCILAAAGVLRDYAKKTVKRVGRLN